MFLSGENCTAQRPHVTQRKGDSAEGEKTVGVFLLPEQWGGAGSIQSASPASGLPRCNSPEQKCRALSPEVSGEWGRCHIAWLHCPDAASLCLCSTGSWNELWCPLSCGLQTGVRCSMRILWSPQRDWSFAPHRQFSPWCVLFHMKLEPSTLVCYLRHFWRHSGTLPIKDEVREKTYSFLQQTQRKNKTFHVQSSRI